jgi:hypothetical protein
MILARAAEQLEALANPAAVAKRHRNGKDFQLKHVRKEAIDQLSR